MGLPYFFGRVNELGFSTTARGVVISIIKEGDVIGNSTAGNVNSGTPRLIEIEVRHVRVLKNSILGSIPWLQVLSEIN